MNYKFPPRGPDHVAEALAAVLSTKRALEFKEIFDIVHAILRSKDLAKGGEEMLRLRTHEKLQGFVGSGFVDKDTKEYKGVPKKLKEFFKLAAEHNARVGTPFRPGVLPQVSETTASKSGGKITKLPVKKLKSVKRKPAQTR
jgi:hypothetical protein